MINHKRVNVATKMSWAALRETTQVEDTAYSLLGLFDINMPLLYGEGSKAFVRLQHEILQTQELDESIFAWTDAKIYQCGLLARSPAAFALSGNIISVIKPNWQNKPPNVTKRILTMEGFDTNSHHQLSDSIHDTKPPSPFIMLNCVGIELTRRDTGYITTLSSETLDQRGFFLDYFVRIYPGKLLQCKSLNLMVAVFSIVR